MEGKNLIVLKDFADKYNFSKVYKAGDTITQSKKFDEERVNDLISRGLVKVEGSDETTEGTTEETTEGAKGGKTGGKGKDKKK